jgi:predicted hydrocarbon binding protein
MMGKSSSGYFYPNVMGRNLLLALEEILGQTGVRTVLKQMELEHLTTEYPPENLDLSFPFEDISQIQLGLEKIYGDIGGLGLALRTGRASFKYNLRDFGPLLGLTNLSYRLLPLPEKIHSGVESLAKSFNKFSHQRVHVENGKEEILWHSERCPICWGRQATQPICHLSVGLLQESLYWISGGKFFNIEEIECIANGGASCAIRIDTKPIN